MLGEDSLSDDTLAAQVVHLRDRRAFDTLVERHQKRVWLFLKRLTNGDAAEAEDLCQETFLQAWRKLHQFRGNGRFAAWLSTLAYRQFLMSIRKTREAPIANPPEALDTPDLGAEMELERLLDRLPHDDALLLTLSYGVELTHAEIGEMLEQPTGTIKSKIHRAKSKLAEYLAQSAPTHQEHACG